MATITQACPAIDQCGVAGWSPIADRDLVQVGSSQVPQRWPPKALEAMQAQLALVRNSSSRLKVLKDIRGVPGSEKQSADAEILLAAYGPTVVPRDSTAKEIEVDTAALRGRGALPVGWEQFLNVTTGEVYYVDWSCCKKARHDPREVQREVDARLDAKLSELKSMMNQMEEMLEEEEDDDDYEDEEGEGDEKGEEQEDEDDGDDDSKARTATEVLYVAKGCQSCLKFVLCPYQALCCPTCGAPLILCT